ncbi:transcriptional repressor p66 alpha-like isoform X3 [Gouania willdenowi]|uniref:transcriptional repressor p66 alpha-like isoform X3 n=1 Tax=Gouania willdenowi TaxID=441366 RepID=UPI001054463D|nr:transcriptional repressor p66 alpha-like isoform X3 [Gouania willdenowi]XP_028328550.1 transcriptional repressor p66 alpha-like isoform X3 [Gouania willdenowi]
MSEEAARQTRSQKRALEREAAPLSDSENEIKKPKVDVCELTDPGSGLTDQDTTDRTLTDPQKQEQEGEEEKERGRSQPPPLDLPPLSPPTKDDGNIVIKRHQTDEHASDNQSVSNDSRTQLRHTETKASIMVATEMKATIKVELQTGEQPVDMSTSRGIKKEKRPLSPDEDDDDDDDVIILSDNDSASPPMNGLSHCRELDTDLLMKSSPVERERIIKQLKEELRLEEAKLVLLKKLRQSQIQRDAQQKTSNSSNTSAPPPLIRGTNTNNKVSPQILTGRSSGTVIPPPLVRGGQQLSSKHGAQVIMPTLVRGSQIQALRQQQQLGASGGSGAGPPPLLGGSRTFTTAQGQTGLVQQGLLRVGSSNSNSLGSSSGLKGSSSGNSISLVGLNDSPASRQAAAKLALRKQLEKTLMEIPPPKPPSPDFNFMPSAANNEFIYLVGLEEVVHNLLDSIHRSKTGRPLVRNVLKEPFTCTQCSTDFTCQWRLDKAKGGVTLCEDCMSSNQKKALKAEHTNRLKSAFVKALQQEQEIEQRLIQTTMTKTTTKAEQVATQQMKQVQARLSALQQQQHQQARGSAPHQHQHHQHHHQQANRASNILHHHTIKQQSSQGHVSRGVSSVGGVRGVPHSFSSSSQLQSAVAAAALVSRPGKHAHVPQRSVQSSKVSSSGFPGHRNASGGGGASAAAWRKQSHGNTGVTMAYVNPSLTGHKASGSVDARQREYLLDMIPSRSSISQTAANTWK